MFFSKIRAILSIYAVMVFAIVGLYAQTGQGTIVGLVSDSTGARIVSVAVRVTNKETSVASSISSNEGGLYRVSYLNPGKYDVVFEAPGFKKTIRQGVTLRVGDVLPVDVSLELGATTEACRP